MNDSPTPASRPTMDPTASRTLTGRISRVQSDLGHIATAVLRPAALAIAVLFSLFTVYAAFVFPPAARVPMALYNLVLVAAGAKLYMVCGRTSLSARAVNIVVTVLSIAILGSIIFGALAGAYPLFSFCIALLVIASAGTVLSAWWGLAIAAIEIAGWAITAELTLSREQVIPMMIVMACGLAVAFLVHAVRHVVTMRMLELRDGDAERELVLQRALAEADDARRELDRKVDDRTRALRSELDQRERLESELRHAQKLDAIGRLAGGIAHDFNNLLTVIRMSHATLRESDASPEDIHDSIRDASYATDRAAALTHDLLAFARKQTLERVNVTVSDVLGGVERMVRRVAEASIRIEVRTAPDVGEVIADRHQIEQVLLNLAINACDAMGNRGTLLISADNVELSGAEAAAHRVSPGHYVRLAVTDTGTGMDEVTKRSVFEPFFTTKEVGRGTGLGLAVAHGIVTQHCGQIEVETELGKGSTFTVLLPRARGASRRNTVSTGAPLCSLRRETVLVVEDELAVRRAVQRNLERLGYRVIAAHDGEDALRIADSLAEVDLLLSDVVMPGIDGPELACRLRAKWHDLPVLFVTGYSADRLARSDAVGPRDRVLEKPYRAVDLARTIREMLEARGPSHAVAAPAA